MVSPEIAAREGAKTLDLLRFALEREGVDKTSYAVAMRPAELGPVDDQLCLTRDTGWLGGESWQVFYVERGERRAIATFAEASDAARFLFWDLTGARSPYVHREAWEAETGQSFSML